MAIRNNSLTKLSTALVIAGLTSAVLSGCTTNLISTKKIDYKSEGEKKS